MIEVFGPWLLERNLLFASNHFFWVTTSRPTFFVCLPNLVTFLKQKISLQERGERGTRDRDRTPGTSWAEHPRVTNPSLRHRCHKDRKYIGSVQLRRKKRETPPTEYKTIFEVFFRSFLCFRSLERRRFRAWLEVEQDRLKISLRTLKEESVEEVAAAAAVKSLSVKGIARRNSSLDDYRHRSCNQWGNVIDSQQQKNSRN